MAPSEARFCSKMSFCGVIDKKRKTRLEFCWEMSPSSSSSIVEEEEKDRNSLPNLTNKGGAKLEYIG